MKSRLNKYIKKQSWNQVSIYDAHYDSPTLQKLLANPEDFCTNLLKNDLATTLWLVPIEGRVFVVKRYNIKNFWYALKRGFTQSRAARNWRNALYLMDCGIPTPTPIAMIEKRWGPWRKTTYFINEYMPGADTHHQMTDQIHEILKKFHVHKISHGDMKLTNILVSNDQVLLLDLDSMRIHRIRNFCFRRAHQKDRDRVQKELNLPAGNSFPSA